MLSNSNQVGDCSEFWCLLRANTQKDSLVAVRTDAVCCICDAGAVGFSFPSHNALQKRGLLSTRQASFTSIIQRGDPDLWALTI